jgi:hypothetical protein
LVRIVGERGTAKIRAILTSVHGALLVKKIARLGCGILMNFGW